ncbi:type I-E CRISPR-associated protein Cas6/Cse3/CasE [Vreelandella azerica]|nr:type I-E CRISPR-associated protein Cas6/Cse3/CasE [Halomonas azerica]
MQVHYYEATALCHPGNVPDQVVTLEDYHRKAWQLFTDHAHYRQRERPFIFRADWLTQSRHLFTIRSIHEFPHAQHHCVDVSHGTELSLSWQWVPTMSTRLSPTGQRLKRSQHIPAPRERWPNLLVERMEHQGFAIDPATLSISPLGKWHHRRQKAQQQEVVWVDAQVKVIDETLAANAWLKGVSRLRAYGMGMLCQGG